jgi:hypothetical protein
MSEPKHQRPGKFRIMHFMLCLCYSVITMGANSQALAASVPMPPSKRDTLNPEDSKRDLTGSEKDFYAVATTSPKIKAERPVATKHPTTQQKNEKKAASERLARESVSGLPPSNINASKFTKAATDVCDSACKIAEDLLPEAQQNTPEQPKETYATSDDIKKLLKSYILSCNEDAPTWAKNPKTSANVELVGEGATVTGDIENIKISVNGADVSVKIPKDGTTKMRNIVINGRRIQ